MKSQVRMRAKYIDLINETDMFKGFSIPEFESRQITYFNASNLKNY